MTDQPFKLPKYLQTHINQMTFPRLLIAHEKYGDIHYLLRDEAALYRAALMILRRRIAARWFIEPEPLPEGADFGKIIPDDVLEKLPKDMQDDARRRNRRDMERFATLKQEHDLWGYIQMAVRDGSGEAAWFVLNERREHEYEGFDLVSPEIP